MLCSYIVVYSGVKVYLKGSVKEEVKQDAYIQFCNSMSTGVSSGAGFGSRYAYWVARRVRKSE